MLILKMCQRDQQVVLLVFPYHFQQNMSIVLRVPSQVDTQGIYGSLEKSYYELIICTGRSVLLLFRCTVMFTVCL